MTPAELRERLEALREAMLYVLHECPPAMYEEEMEGQITELTAIISALPENESSRVCKKCGMPIGYGHGGDCPLQEAQQ